MDIEEMLSEHEWHSARGEHDERVAKKKEIIAYVRELDEQKKLFSGLLLDLFEACLIADAEGELSDRVDGVLLDKIGDALHYEEKRQMEDE